MKLIYVCEDYLDGKDAQTTHVLEFFENAKTFCDIVCFSPDKKGMKHIEGIKYISVPDIRFVSSIYFQIALFFHMLHDMVSYGKMDIIYARHSIYTISAMLFCNIFRVPYLIELNGLKVDEMDLRDHSSASKRIVGFIEKISCEKARKIIVVTEGIKKEVSARYKIPEEKIVVVSNGVNTDLFKPLNMNESRVMLNFDPFANIICFVGHLAPWQGVEYLINASKIILAHEPNTIFLVVGDGEIKESLIKNVEDLNVSDKFIFTGNVAYEKVPLYINSSDICVVPKKPLKSGYSPLKLYEYMACCKPIIASKVDGFEILEQINAGILIDPQASEEFSEAAIKLLSDERLRNKMGSFGYDYVKKDHSWNAIAKKVLDICEDALGE